MNLLTGFSLDFEVLRLLDLRLRLKLRLAKQPMTNRKKTAQYASMVSSSHQEINDVSPIYESLQPSTVPPAVSLPAVIVIVWVGLAGRNDPFASGIEPYSPLV